MSSFFKITGKAAVWVKAMPMMFTSNDVRLFNTDEDVWNSRVYYYQLQSIETKQNVWTDETRNKKLNPLAFVNLFNYYKLLTEIE